MYCSIYLLPEEEVVYFTNLNQTDRITFSFVQQFDDNCSLGKFPQYCFLGTLPKISPTGKAALLCPQSAQGRCKVFCNSFKENSHFCQLLSHHHCLSQRHLWILTMPIKFIKETDHSLVLVDLLSCIFQN